MSFESLLRPWSDDRVLFRDATHCVVDKPAPVACEPDSVGESGDDLRRRLGRQGVRAPAVVLAPPPRASGVKVLALEEHAREASPKGALAAPLRAVTCTVAVDGWQLQSRGTLSLAPSRPAQLEYRVARRHGSRVLIEVRLEADPGLVPSALAAAGQAVVGHAGSGAAAATRLMLHVDAVEGLPHAAAALPIEFESWLGGAPTLGPEHFASVLAQRGVERYGCWPAAEAFRLLSEESGDVSGVTVDRYGDHAVIAISSDDAWQLRARFGECLMDHGARGVYVKRRLRADLRGADPGAMAPSQPLCGTPAPQALYVRQGAFGMWAYLADGLSTGIFLDQRSNWRRVLEGARGASVLNLFSYTGAFSVAAAAGGAHQTTSVDLAGKALGRLDQNLALCGLSGPSHRLLKADVPRWLARAGRASRRYDWIVLDPPSFGTRARGVLRTDRDYSDLIRGTVALLAPGGRLLCVSHHRKIGQAELCDRIRAELERAGFSAQLEPLVGGWDCPTLPGVSMTQSVLATRT